MGDSYYSLTFRINTSYLRKACYQTVPYIVTIFLCDIYAQCVCTLTIFQRLVQIWRVTLLVLVPVSSPPNAWQVTQLKTPCFNECRHSKAIKSFLNGPTPASFSFIFVLFKQTIQFLQRIYLKNVHPVYSPRIRTHNLWNVSLFP